MKVTKKDRIYKRLVKELDRNPQRISPLLARLYPKLYEYLREKNEVTTIHARLVYEYLQGHKPRRCKTCGKPPNFKNFKQGWMVFCCVSCMQHDPEVVAKRIATNRENHGTDWPSQSPEVRKKVIATLQENYGVDVPAKSKKILRKMQRTTLERYGVKNGSQSEIIKERKRRTFRKTSGGYDYPFQSPEAMKKAHATMLERYGAEFSTQSQTLREKTRRTNIRKYGVENVMQSPSVQAKGRETNLKRYGVPFPMQDPEVYHKRLFRVKHDTIHGKKFRFQGYEGITIRLLVEKYGVPVDRIHTKCRNFAYKSGGKNRRYYPDIRIHGPNTKLYIEVKSEYTAGFRKGIRSLDATVLRKVQAVVSKGYPILLVIVRPESKSKKAYVSHFLYATPGNMDWNLYEGKRNRRWLLAKFNEVRWA